MPRSNLLRRGRAARLLGFVLLGALIAGCGTLPFTERPAAGYTHGSGAQLRVAIVDQTGGGAAWTPSIARGVATYAGATPQLHFQGDVASAHIVLTFRRYTDADPPALEGYVFPPGAGGFAAVYDVNRTACNYPPTPLPMGCTGEIAHADIYLNDAIPPGSDIEARRLRLILHEMGHALGLTRHSPDLGLADLAVRYGW